MRKSFLTMALVLVVCAIPSATAHANFLDSEPGQGVRLGVAPEHVSVTLTQDVDAAGSALRVLDDMGRRVDNDDLQVEQGPEPTLEVTLVANLTDGVYRVEWKALSRVDHHTTQGRFAFAVGNFTAPATEPASPNEAAPASMAGRLLFFAGFFLATASLLFSLFVAPGSAPGTLRAVNAFGWLSIVAGSAVLVVDAASRAGLPAEHWTHSAVVRDLVYRTVAASVAAAAILLPMVPARVRNSVAVVGLVATALFSARSGHSSSMGWFATTVDALHLVATAAWVGGLVLFAYLLVAGRRVGVGAPSLIDIGRRFSRTALTAVVAMAATGVTLGILILGWPDLERPLSYFDGTYGAALAGKILLAATMVGLAAVNRFVFLRRIGTAEVVVIESVRPRFGRFVAGEASIGVVVVILAAVLTSTSPPYQPHEPRPVEVTGQGEEFAVRMVFERPPEAGAYSDLRLQLTWRQDNSTLVNDTCGRPSGCILLEVVPPGAEEHDEDREDVHHGGEHRILEPLGDGWWIVRDVLFVEPGEYEFLVEIQTEYVFFDVVALNHVIEGPAHDEHAGHRT